MALLTREQFAELVAVSCDASPQGGLWTGARAKH
jgi:hypothetical protein